MEGSVIAGPPKLMGWEGREERKKVREALTECQICHLYLQSLGKAVCEQKMMSGMRCMYQNSSCHKSL